MKRLPFLDHARGLVIALVALQHATQTYARYWGGKYFVLEAPGARLGLFDGLFMWTDAFIMQALFLIAGLFVMPSLQRHGMGGFWQRKMTRIILPWACGVLFLAPMLSFVIYLQKQDPGATYLDYWFNIHFAHSLPQAGYWFLSYLMMLSGAALLVVRACPTALEKLGALVRNAAQRPLLSLFCLGFVCAILVTIADLIYGTPYWSAVLHIFVARSNMMWTYVLFFVLGLGIRASGLLEQDATLQRFGAAWPAWAASLAALSVPYIWYCATHIPAGAVTDALLHARHWASSSAEVWPVLKQYLPWILPRTVMHGFLMVLQVGTLLSIVYHFTNTARGRLWASLGACSYGIYFFHEHLCVWVQYALVDMDLPVAVKWMAAFFISLLGSWGFTKGLQKLPLLRRVF